MANNPQTTPQQMIDYLRTAWGVTMDEHMCEAVIKFIEENSDARDD